MCRCMGCVRMLYNDSYSVPFPDCGWKQTFVILDRFLNESRWLVFGDLLRASLSSVFYLPPYTASHPHPPHKWPWLSHNKLHSHRSPSICVTPGIPWTKMPLHYPQHLCIIKAGITASKVFATALVTELKDTKQWEMRRQNREKGRERLMIKS